MLLCKDYGEQDESDDSMSQAQNLIKRKDKLNTSVLIWTRRVKQFIIVSL